MSDANTPGPTTPDPTTPDPTAPDPATSHANPPGETVRDETTPDFTGSTRSIEIEIEVAGTPEEVWNAIATGPGISSWFVPHVVDGRVGGIATASFGPEPEMQAPGIVTAWEPPHRIVIGNESGEGLAFEWLVEARGGGSCVVRLVNSGFGTGNDWDDQYDGMQEGWAMFLTNLRLHLAHFRGQHAMPMLSGAMWPGPRGNAWKRLLAALGTGHAPQVGQRIATLGSIVPPLAGTVTEVTAHRISLLLDQPTVGTALIAAEGDGGHISISIWSYLYGPDAAAIIARDEGRWSAWFAGIDAG